MSYWVRIDSNLWNPLQITIAEVKNTSGIISTSTFPIVVFWAQLGSPRSSRGPQIRALFLTSAIVILGFVVVVRWSKSVCYFV